MKAISLPIITAIALWQLMLLGTGCTVFKRYIKTEVRRSHIHMVFFRILEYVHYSKLRENIGSFQKLK